MYYVVLAGPVYYMYVVSTIHASIDMTVMLDDVLCTQLASLSLSLQISLPLGLLPLWYVHTPPGA